MAAMRPPAGAIPLAALPDCEAEAEAAAPEAELSAKPVWTAVPALLEVEVAAVATPVAAPRVPVAVEPPEVLEEEES